MRPRGLSSSSPSSTKVGQVAVQNPQWTQVRSTVLDEAVSGSRSCSAVKLVCMNALLEYFHGRQHAMLADHHTKADQGRDEEGQRKPRVHAFTERDDHAHHQ